MMTLAQAGIPNAVALGGTTVSDCQLACLQRASRLILMLDGDDAGYRAARRYHQQALHPRLATLHPPEGKDPADLSEVHLRRLLAPLSPSIPLHGNTPR
ncbi:MAG: toprim domain-containing protein [Candidatus Riflebacteria bacterium]|nr:toprim domain-containing protein [Candidatus Riflebacteria bacterium]